MTQPRSAARAIVSLTSARQFPSTMPSTPACSYAAQPYSTLSNQQRRRETARCRTVCGYWVEMASYAPSTSARLPGKMSIHHRHWPTQKVSLTSGSTKCLRGRVSPVSNPGRRRIALRILTVVFGVGLLIYLVRRVGPDNLLANVETLGWGLALIIALGGVTHLVRAWAWRMTLAGWRGKTSLLRMLQVRIASEAAGQVGILGHLFGDGLRISAFDEAIPIDNRISSVILDRALFIAAGTIMSGVGILAALFVLSLSHALQWYATLFAVTLISLLFLLALAVLKRWRFLSRPAQYLGQLQRFRGRVENALPLIYSVERQLFDFHTSTPGPFWSAVALNLACHGMAVLEVYLILWLLGVKIGIIGALIFEGLTKLVNAVGSFNPGNIGTYEGGNVLIARLFGITGAVGLAVALARRSRAIFWAAVGGVFLVMLSRSNEARDSGDDGTRGRVSETPDTKEQIEATNQSVKAVILANTREEVDQGRPPESRVGTLPILLRDILSVQKAGV